MFSKLKSRSSLIVVPLIIAGVYFLWPTSPPPCSSLQRFKAIEQDGRCVIPRNTTLEGNLNRLPDRLRIKGNLTISGTYITELPTGMVVEGSLFLYKTSIAKLPADLRVEGTFDQYSGFGSPGVKCSDIPKTAYIKGFRGCH